MLVACWWKIADESDFSLSALSKQEQLVFATAAVVLGRKKTLPDAGQRLGGASAGNRWIDRYFAPSQARKSHGGSECRYLFLHAKDRLGTDKQHSHAEATRQLDSQSRCPATKKSLRSGREQTSAITACPIGIDSTSMRQSLQRGQRTVHHLMRSETGELYYEPGSTSIMVRMPTGGSSVIIRYMGELPVHGH